MEDEIHFAGSDVVQALVVAFDWHNFAIETVDVLGNVEVDVVVGYRRVPLFKQQICMLL